MAPAPNVLARASPGSAQRPGAHLTRVDGNAPSIQNRRLGRRKMGVSGHGGSGAVRYTLQSLSIWNGAIRRVKTMVTFSLGLFIRFVAGFFLTGEIRTTEG